MKNFMILIIILISVNDACCWDDTDTHPRITEYAVSKFFEPSFLLEDLALSGVTKKATFWLQDGSRLEDAGIKIILGLEYPDRSVNHFHDPTKPLNEAGLSDLPISPQMSTVLWAQNRAAQSAATGGDWSWQQVRDHYYHHLTGTDKQTRDAYLARKLMGLGYQMHLVQDMSQPNHVRNDTHLYDGKGNKPIYGFETWAKTNYAKVDSILANNFMIVMNTSSVDLLSAYEGGLAPVARLYDSRNNLRLDITVIPNMTYILPSTSFSQGLAEYTNTNFYSEDSIFAAEKRAVGNRYFFPYPKKSETDLQNFIDKSLPTIPFFDSNKTYQNFRIGKTATTGEALNCVAKPTNTTAKYYKAFGEGQFFYGSFVADEECFEEQATKLLPRAAGYSIAMLDYFFRGKLKITAPTVSYSGITLTAANDTTGENMVTGEVDLVVRYKPLTESGTGTVKQLDAPSADFTYKVIKTTGVDMSAQQNLSYTFTDGALPMFYSEMAFQLVYRGPLGNEQDSVAVSPWVPVGQNTGNTTDITGGTGGGSGGSGGTGGTGGSGASTGTISVPGISSDISIALPSSSVYAKTQDNSFTELGANVSTSVPGGLNGGRFELIVGYRTATSDPFQSQAVVTMPAGAYSYLVRYPVKTGVTSLAQGATSDLMFDLSAAPISVNSTDVKIHIAYFDGNNQLLATGDLNISEPTPVDIVNDADMKCVNNTWYKTGSTDLLYIADSDGDGEPDLLDPYPHNISNIYYRISPVSAPVNASSANYTFSSPAILAAGSYRRIGYFLGDSSFNFHTNEMWSDAFEGDPFSVYGADQMLLGRTISNQGGVFPHMYQMRGKKIWSGASLLYENEEYPESNNPDVMPCAWEDLPAIP